MVVGSALVNAVKDSLDKKGKATRAHGEGGDVAGFGARQRRARGQARRHKIATPSLPGLTRQSIYTV